MLFSYPGLRNFRECRFPRFFSGIRQARRMDSLSLGAIGNEEAQTCENPACNCIVMASIQAGGYCCNQCTRSDEIEEMACKCGHPPCDAR